MLYVHSKIEIHGINPYVPIGAMEAARLKKGWRKPMPVYLQVEGKPDVPWRTNLMPRGDGSFWLYLPQIVRKASGTQVGDTVNVRLRFNQDYQGGPLHPMPRWFSRGLRESHAARAGWERLAPSRQKEILRYFAGLKTPQARARNLQRAVHVLGGAKARFMARDWNPDRR